MKLTSIKIFNYKSYSEIEKISIAPKSTVLVGQNNAGKTAFLEALRANNLVNKPHRKPAQGDPYRVPDPTSRVQLEITVSGAELLHRFLQTGPGLDLPLVAEGDEAVKNFISSFFAHDTFNFEIDCPSDGRVTSRYPSHALFQKLQTPRSVQIIPNSNRQSWQISSGPARNGNDGLPDFILAYYGAALYIFRAERMNVGRCPINNSSELESNASNLASVLLQLPKNASAHELYTDYVREVFPSIYRVIAAPVSSSTAEITVITNDSRAGLSPGVDVPLDDSGTGISQVLAILYVVVTAPAPRIIVIDEPNSFLHPGAAKKLLAILKRMPHQYIVTTHSPEIINSIDPDILHLVKWNGLATSVETSDRGNLNDQRQLLEELGVRLSDVFGADNILWVEGLTEVACFPVLLKHLGLYSAGTAILALVAPDDLTNRKPRSTLAWEIYERISSGSALVAPALAFSFDHELRTDVQIEDLNRRSKGKAKFLPRRTYENYLVNSGAISAVLAKHIVDKAPPTPSDIDAWLIKNGHDPKYCQCATGSEEERLKVVNAPLLLSDLFYEYLVEYRKTLHSVELTEWLLANRPEDLQELLNYVSSLVKGEQAP